MWFGNEDLELLSLENEARNTLCDEEEIVQSRE